MNLIILLLLLLKLSITGQKVAAKVMSLKMGIISFCIFAIINYVMNYHINNSLKYF